MKRHTAHIHKRPCGIHLWVVTSISICMDSEKHMKLVGKVYMKINLIHKGLALYCLYRNGFRSLIYWGLKFGCLRFSNNFTYFSNFRTKGYSNSALISSRRWESSSKSSSLCSSKTLSWISKLSFFRHFKL